MQGMFLLLQISHSTLCGCSSCHLRSIAAILAVTYACRYCLLLMLIQLLNLGRFLATLLIIFAHASGCCRLNFWSQVCFRLNFAWKRACPFHILFFLLSRSGLLFGLGPGSGQRRLVAWRLTFHLCWMSQGHLFSAACVRVRLRCCLLMCCY
ncbi:hypothetical protein BKA80DRAFT_268664 [Phyllosticta citrichinensis]